MKRFLTAIALCLVCAVSFTTVAQRIYKSENFVKEMVDEFGDKTGNIKVGILAQGYFSNSATTNSCAQLLISITKEDSWVDMFEYCSNTVSRDHFTIIYKGTHTNEILVADDYEVPYPFIELCKNNDTINVKLEETGNYATTTAVFKLYHCKDFYNKYKNTFGLPQLVQYKVIGDFLTIFNKPVSSIDNNLDVPQIILNKEYVYNGTTYKPNIMFRGKFSNGESMLAYCHNVKIDGILLKTKYTFSGTPEFTDFMDKLKPGSVVTVECEHNSTIVTPFIITEELYNQIIQFYK